MSDGAPAEPLSILLVDDSPDDRLLARRAIERELVARFIEPLDAAQFEDAVEQGAFAVALIDYRLGWSNGLDVLERIKRRRDVPVIMFTSSGDEEVCAAGMRAGLFDYLLKRLDQFPKLPQAIRLALSVQQQQEALRAHQHQLERSQEQLSLLLERERRARAEAEQARVDALRANRIKDEFLASLSHELRTPLSAIVGWAHILSRRSGEPEVVATGVETILRNAKAQTRLIDDLLDMSRIVSGQVRLDVESVDLLDAVRGPVESMRPAAENAGVSMQALLDPNAGKVRGDPARIQQIVWNLLSNAIKFTPAGGRIQVTVERAGSHVLLSVADTGIGIDPEFLPHVFDRFRQADASTRRSRGGLGLGLAIVKSLTELHGGRVEARSAGTGQGAEFIVQLPVAVFAPAPTPAAHAPLAPGRSLQGLDVLVVDDDADNLDLVRRVLQDAQATVRVAATADAALQAMRQHAPMVLISDIGLPEKDGYQLIAEVRTLPPEHGGHVPAAALSAFARSEDRQRALLAGFDTYAVKPIEPDELVAVVRALAERSGGRRGA